MKLRSKKLIWIAAGIGFVLICTLAVAPSVFNSREEKTNTVTVFSENTEYVSETERLKEFILEHEQLRSMQLNELDEIINSDKSSAEIIDAAQSKKMEILNLLETESTIAGILQSRGYRDAAVAAGGGYINVMISGIQAELTDVARIKELIITQTDVGTDNIKIIPIK